MKNDKKLDKDEYVKIFVFFCFGERKNLVFWNITHSFRFVSSRFLIALFLIQKKKEGHELPMLLSENFLMSVRLVLFFPIFCCFFAVLL